MSVLNPFAGDQVVFLSNVLTQSTPHPPGYIWMVFITYLAKDRISAPVLIILVQTLSLFGSVGGLHLILKSFNLNKILQFSIPIMWACSFGVFRYFLIFENRALGFLFLVLYLVSLFLTCQEMQTENHNKQNQKRNYILLSVSFILACSHHHIFYVLLSPSLLFLLYLRNRSFLHLILNFMCLLILSMVPYLFLPYITQSHLENILSWGDLSTWSGLFTHWSRSEFGSFALFQYIETQWLFNRFYHILRLSFYLLLTTLGLIGIIFINRRKKPTLFSSLLIGSIGIYYFILILLGSIPHEDSWYYAIMLRFWMIPTPMIFLLIAFKLNELIHKNIAFKWVPIGFLIYSIVYLIPNEWRIVSNPLYGAFTKLIIEESPSHSIVVHAHWQDWIRSVLFINKNNRVLSLENSNNNSFHVNLKLLLQQGWPQEQFTQYLTKANIKFNFEEVLNQNLNKVVMVGPKNEKELWDFTASLKVQIEPIGPMLLLYRSSMPIDVENDQKKGLSQCEFLFKQWGESPLDQWIEPIHDYFCFSCISTYRKVSQQEPLSWKEMCQFQK